ncbi:tetratricopeptide repeat protein [Daejeonella lutea]|uniref:Tetratricopeptide repeat-containing protein n=1 Tax=Daejeonella lutea TaxID=572036 RepID=A0A1T5EZ12_9SPHI|nr:tetratricopeptide repeat protein [Daejeonella lutea]SKB89089.1 Tetratricopeptide repeat-containing protein [Daejeonella lutea]
MKKIVVLILVLIASHAHSQVKEADNLHLLDLFQSQRFIEASEYLKQVYQEPISDKKILSRFGYSLKMAGKLTEAEGYYRRILEKDSTEVSTLFSLAGINQTKGNYKKAGDYYKQILAIDSNNFAVYSRLSDMIESSEGLVFATPYLAKANSLNPYDGDIAYSYSKVLKSVKQYKLAGAVLDTAIAADTTNMFLLRGKAELAYAEDKWPVVIEIVNRLIALGEENALQLKMLGEAYYSVKKYTLAIEILSGLEENDQQTESSLYFIAMSYKSLENYPKAIEYFNKTLKESISPNTSEYYALIGDSNQKRNQMKSALASYQKSLFFENKPMTIYSMATIYDQKLNDKATALKYYKRYLEAKPPKDHESYIEYSKYRIAQLGK